MNISIHYRHLDREKVSQNWAELIARKEAADAEKMKPQNPEEVELEIDEDFNSPTKVGRNLTIKEALAQNDREVTLSAIFSSDKRFIDEASQAKFSQEFSLAHEEMLCWLFEEALGIKIEEEEFHPMNAVAGIPLEMWVRLFQGITPQAMGNVSNKAKKKKYNFDSFKAHLLGIKSVVKYCLDNNAEMITFYDTGPSGIMRERAEKVLKRLAPEKDIAKQ